MQAHSDKNAFFEEAQIDYWDFVYARSKNILYQHLAHDERQQFIKQSIQEKSVKGLKFKDYDDHPQLPASLIQDNLIPFLQQNPQITELIFGMHILQFDREAAKALALLIESCQNLKYITIRSNHIVSFQDKISERFGYQEAFLLNRLIKNKRPDILLSLPTYYQGLYDGNDILKKNRATDPNSLDLSILNSYPDEPEFYFSNQDIIDIILPYLKSHPNITSLNLSHSCVGDISDAIIALMDANLNLTHYYLHRCIINNNALQKLSNGKLRALDISGSRMEFNTHIAYDNIADLVEKSPELKLLRLQTIYHEDYNKNSYDKLIQAIARSRIQELVLIRFKIDDDDIKYLCDSETLCLKKLNLSGAYISDVGLLYLSSSRINTTLLSLDLSSTNHLYQGAGITHTQRISDDGLHHFITNNHSLIYLDLNDIPYAPGDKTAIAIALHKTLEVVTLDNMDIAAIKVLYANCHLKIIINDSFWTSCQKFVRNTDCYPLIAEDDPQKRTKLTREEELALRKYDQLYCREVFQPPTLFSMSAHQVKTNLIADLCKTYNLSIIKYNLALMLCNHAASEIFTEYQSNNESFKNKYELEETPCILQCGKSNIWACHAYFIWAKHQDGMWKLSSLSESFKNDVYRIGELFQHLLYNTDKIFLNVPMCVTYDFTRSYRDQWEKKIDLFNITKMLMKYHTTLLEPRTIYIDNDMKNGEEGLQCIIVTSCDTIENHFINKNKLPNSFPNWERDAINKKEHYLPIIVNCLVKQGVIDIFRKDLPILPELKEAIVPKIPKQW